MSGPEFWFYHLERQPPEKVLPQLLEKTLARGWRACLRFSTPERLSAIDSVLWTYRDDSFLPHGTDRESFPERQPILLTLDIKNSNKAEVLFLLEAAEETSRTGYLRIVRLFDGNDEAAKARARAEWKVAKAEGLNVSYWRQSEGGAWIKAG